MQISSRKLETTVYIVIWTVLFIVPVVSIQMHHADADIYPWGELFSSWMQLGSLFLVFLLHNYLLAPLLVYKQKRLPYFTGIALLTFCFALLQCVHQPDDVRGPHHHHHHPPTEQRADKLEWDFDEEQPADFHDDHQPAEWEHRHRGHHQLDKPVRPLFDQHDLVTVIILILMLGMNVGVKLYFKQRDDQRRIAELEKESLQQQLEYLRYQINPHFLMNTLNNIHALVDIDSERAKETIIELSKIMRYALYEGSRQRVPLSRDIAFMKSYIHLMRLRYTEKVSISVDVPGDLPDCEIPPMIFITFVENAFKHGVSYRQESFVNIGITVESDHLLFTCRNSKLPQSVNAHSPHPNEGGVGLQNVQQRLQLLYGNDYHLTIDDRDDAYSVELRIPL